MKREISFIRIYYVIALIILLPLTTIYTQDLNKNETKDKQTGLKNESLIYKDLKAYVSTQKNVYNYEDPIYLQLSVLNPGSPFSIIRDNYNYMLSYFIEVYTDKGIAVKERDDVFAKRFNLVEKLKKATPDELKTEFASSYFTKDSIVGAQFNLIDYFDLKPGTYIVRLKFYPTTFFYNPFNFIYSSYIQVIIQDKEEQSEQEKLAKMQFNIHTPQDAIHAYFEGKQTANWNEFFYVIDLTDLIQIFNEFNQSYNAALDEAKFNILNDFKTYLQDLNSDEKIISYNMNQITIRHNEAIANVIVTTSYKGRSLSREYKFKLQLKDHWRIVAYTVLQK